MIKPFDKPIEQWAIDYEGAISQKARGDNRPPWKAVLGKNAWKPLPRPLWRIDF